MKIEDIYGNLPTLETERLILRKMTMDDTEDMFEYASDPEISIHSTWESHISIEATRDFLERIMKAYEENQVAGWGVVLKENNKLIGTSGYVNWSTNHNRAEIGYAISRSLWNKGLMTEAVNEVIRFGFNKMELNRIEARCKLENIGSERVMQKVGMTMEGILREQVFMKGSYHDLKLYSLLRKDY